MVAVLHSPVYYVLFFRQTLNYRYSHIYVAQAAGQEDPQNMAFHNASQMVGKTFTFQLKLTDFNLSASISLSQSHAYLIPTITHHFLILLIRFVHQLHFIGWVWHTWIRYPTVVFFTWRSGQLKRLHARSWFWFKNLH